MSAIDDLEGDLELMAVFDRQDDAVASCPEPQLESMDQARAEQIYAEARRLAPPRPASSGHRIRWVLPAVGMSMAAAALLWLGGVDRGSPEPVTSDVATAPHRIELGGTARTLGSDHPTPRAYRPGDDFLLRAVPLRDRAEGAAATGATLFAIPADGPRRRLELPRTRASDGVIEFRGDIAALLAPGRWTLRLELSASGECTPRSDNCVEAEAHLEILAR